ncbi:LytR C-terminal domain-containing protein [Streptomyces chiangmaiensis]|uniref:LytR C-terminal domain-containing protein n=1 Tax=Streptomyces chiangmaiensis TaxID=766497 RepID=A0ABU7FPP3_9ACTN|nr:LytR C-terminal domain-containing protein [Streptomyces chiangmaiensis]MED7826034.1 LytR C-terminal domain-containing protein [Streptomyces chiangmaiensis]
MSMLTPPGMGGQYRITGDKYPRMRRPRRRGRVVFAVVASVAAIGVIGWGTLQLIDVFTGQGGKASASGAKANCATKANASPAALKALPAPGQITVNVLNATPRSGLAKQTADELKKRGFHIGDVGNATEEFDKKIKGVALLLGPKAAVDTSLPVLGAQLPAAERRTDPARTGAAVDLILGDGFKSLSSKTDADKALAALTGPTASPSGDTKKGC